MNRLLEHTTQEGAVILCRRNKDCVMCVDQIEGAKGRQIVSYERGVAMLKSATRSDMNPPCRSTSLLLAVSCSARIH